MRRRRIVAAALILLGVGLLAHPIYLYTHVGQTAYFLGVDGARDDTPAGEAIAYADLPPDARAAFDAARRGGAPISLWSGEDRGAVSVLRSHEYVRYEGRYYSYALGHGDRGFTTAFVVRPLLTALGSLLLVLGALIAHAGGSRPFTPGRAVAVPAVAAFGGYAMEIYDARFDPGFPSPIGIGAFLFVLLLAVPLGSLVKRRGSRTALPLLGGGVALLVVGAVVAGSPPAVPFVLGAVLVVGGLPWLALGHALSGDDDPVDPGSLRLPGAVLAGMLAAGAVAVAHRAGLLAGGLFGGAIGSGFVTPELVASAVAVAGSMALAHAAIGRVRSAD